MCSLPLDAMIRVQMKLDQSSEILGAFVFRLMNVDQTTSATLRWPRWVEAAGSLQVSDTRLNAIPSLPEYSLRKVQARHALAVVVDVHGPLRFQ